MKRVDLKKRDDMYVMQPNNNGRYVPYKDAAELQRQLAEVTAERDSLRTRLEFADARINTLIDEKKGAK